MKKTMCQRGLITEFAEMWSSQGHQELNPETKVGLRKNRPRHLFHFFLLLVAMLFVSFSSSVFDLEQGFITKNSKTPEQTMETATAIASTKIVMTKGSVGNPHRLRLVGIKK